MNKDEMIKKLNDQNEAIVLVLEWIKEFEDDNMMEVFPEGNFLGVKFGGENDKTTD